jgi:glycosyltransferase involved in cell wall biosynthesis
VHTALPDAAYTAAVRLSQPWHIQEMVDLHSVALVNAYLVLDTIAWDIAYATVSHLEGTWQFLAKYADGLLYDSTFTRDRFLKRFPAASDTPGVVTHLSFDPSDYVRLKPVESGHDAGFVLVIGNDLAHKDVQATVETLASAFPFHPMTVLGSVRAVSPMITVTPSGERPDTEVHRLYATAQYVIFPSFYEGFGFPVVTALAYGRTVLARRSQLLEEVAAHCAPRGRLIMFDTREELVDVLGRLLHGESIADYPLGSDLSGGRPKAWQDVAERTLAFIESITPGDASPARWFEREEMVRALVSFRT